MVKRLVRRYFWPRTVLGLVLFGFLLAGAPLIAGLLVSAQQIGQLTHEGEEAIDQAVSITREARGVMDRLLAVERSARQFRILQDEEARSNYRGQREAFLRQVTSMTELDMPPTLRVELTNLLTREAMLADQVLLLPGPDPWPPVLAETFGELLRMAQWLLDASESVAERAVVHLQGLGEQANGMVYVLMAAAIPLAVVFALVFTGLITRPIRRLDSGIRSLARPETAPILPLRGPRDLRVLSVRLEWVRRRLARIEKDRQRLLSQVSHELKTPLSSIGEGVSLLQDELFGALSGGQVEVLEILRDNTRRLEQQIESLLRFNHVRSGLSPGEISRQALEVLVREVLSAHALTTTARNIRVACRVEPDLRVEGDPDMLRTALENLLSNAIKFSPDGGQVGIDAQREADRIVIRVMDNGRGIPSGDRHRLFEPFYRGRASAEGAVPGSGLGLSICRELIRAHGGDVRLIQVNGWQTAFECSLPHAD